MFSLTGKTALVSGAAHGIGRGISEILAEAGAHVFLCDVDDEHGLQAAASICSKGGMATFMRADVSDGEEVRTFAASAEQQTGRIDIVCCNASYTVGSQHDLLNASDEEWESNIEIGLMGTRHLVKAALPAMMRQQGGSIIIISSVQALAACPGSAAYTSIKAAQLGLVRSLALDYGRYNIRANAICPGPIRVRYSPQPGTPDYEWQIEKTVLKRIGEPREIGYATLFLASDEASYITGAVLPVDGGWTTI